MAAGPVLYVQMVYALRGQRGAGEDGFATVVVLTHETSRAALDAALAGVAASGVSGAAPVSLGIED